MERNNTDNEISVGSYHNHDKYSTIFSNSNINQQNDQLNSSDENNLLNVNQNVNNLNEERFRISGEFDTQNYRFINNEDKLIQRSNSASKLTDIISDENYMKNSKKFKDKSSKKPWYSAFTFTYKQKNEDFRRIFRDLPTDERLLVDYACALQKEILAQGRLYISLNYVCFYANILGWETNLTIRLKDIQSIQKDKTAKFIPNAITIITNSERLFFTSFASRDKTYTTLFKMWQTAILEQSMGNDEVTNILRSFYGDDLGYNSDDDEYEYYTKMKANKLNSDIVAYKTDNIHDSIHFVNSDANISQISFNLSENSSTDQVTIKNSPSRIKNETIFNENDDFEKKPALKMKISPSSISDQQNLASNIMDDKLKLNDQLNQKQESSQLIKQQKLDIDSTSPIGSSSEELRTDEVISKQNAISTVDADMDASSEDSLNAPVNCDCDEHIGKEMINKTYSISVNHLFECIFGHSEFCKKFWESRKFFDMKIGDWQTINGYRTRRLEYSLILHSTIGVRTCKNSEEQKLIKYIPNKLIIMESLSSSQGVPYADTFAIACRYCITKSSESKATIKAYAQIKYLQKPMFVVKAFIEKNAFGALNDAYQYLVEYVFKEFINTGILCHNSDANCIFKSSCSIAINNNDKEIINYDSVINTNSIANSIEKQLPLEKESKNDSITEISALKNKTSQKDSEINTNISDNHNSNKNSLKQRRSRHMNDLNSGKTNGKKFQQQNSIHVNDVDDVNMKNSTNLIPIQTFSFLKWSINVDTLVRLFIIAMICLMVINAMLYYKLRRIEILADGLRNDPQIISKYQKLINENPQSHNNLLHKDVLIKEISEWKEMITSILRTIEKIGYPISDKHLHSNLNNKNEI